MSRIAVLAALYLSIAPALYAQDDLPDPTGPAIGDLAPPTFMTGDRLGFLVQQIDEGAVSQGNGHIFQVAERDLMVVYDETADRMRIISPILPAEGLPPELLERMLQANYDAVLDARYAIANGQVWSVFIHPLSSLTDEDFLSGVAQTTLAAETFGTTFSSGAVVFGGGDTQDLHDDLRRRLEQALGEEAEERGI